MSACSWRGLLAVFWISDPHSHTRCAGLELKLRKLPMPLPFPKHKSGRREIGAARPRWQGTPAFQPTRCAVTFCSVDGMEVQVSYRLQLLQCKNTIFCAIWLSQIRFVDIDKKRVAYEAGVCQSLSRHSQAPGGRSRVGRVCCAVDRPLDVTCVFEAADCCPSIDSVCVLN